MPQPLTNGRPASRGPQLCDSCGKPINLGTGECAGCSD